MIESERPDLSLVIPVYNSEKSIGLVVNSVAEVLTASGISHEFVLVNDGSRDFSWEEVRRLSAVHRNVAGLNLLRNYGQHNALLAGILRARAPVIVTLDDDHQHPAETIPLLLSKLNEGFDVVYGTPTNMPHSLMRTLLARLTRLVLAKGMGADVATNVSALRAFRTRLRTGFEHYGSPDVSIDVLLTWTTRNFASIPVSFRERQLGTSNYTWYSLMRHAMTMMTGFSTLPLRFASITGLAFTVVGLMILLFVLVAVAVSGRAVPGFAFLASVIAIFSGAQLFALGVIGEYLARMHVRLMGRPSFIVIETILPPSAPKTHGGGAESH